MYKCPTSLAAVHAEAPSAADTDWRQIVGLYEVLLRIEHTPVVALNRAVAVGFADGPAPVVLCHVRDRLHCAAGGRQTMREEWLVEDYLKQRERAADDNGIR